MLNAGWSWIDILGGFFRKLIYTSLGIGGAAAVCYPKAAKDVVNAAYSQATTLVKGKSASEH